MQRILAFFWPLLGCAAVVVSIWLLFREFRGEAIGPQVWSQLKAISPLQYALATASTIAAYAALAWYDRIALLHLHVRHISWTFVSLCSFTTYALGHNIGASVFSGAMVRYRAYHSKGLSAAEVAILVALCSLTFGLGTLLLGGLILVFEPEQLQRLSGLLPAMLTTPAFARMVGLGFLGFVALYVIGSLLGLKPLEVAHFRLEYPRPAVMIRQLIAAPLELLGAAGIIYFSLPAEGHPGYFVILGVFLASFSAALVSNAPGGLGVFELLFIKAVPSVPQVQVLTALLVFRLLYLLLPLAFALVIVVLFERRQLNVALHPEAVAQGPLAPPAEGAPKDGQIERSSVS